MIIRLELNQDKSPLLRLPAEIRDMIWRYALEGKTFFATCRMNPHTKHITRPKLKRSRRDPIHGAALLRTCRQIFLETASYPITLGSLSCEDPNVLVAAVKKLRAHQRKEVTRIRMKVSMLDIDVSEAIESEWCPQMIRRSLPAAKDLALKLDYLFDMEDESDYIKSVRADLNKVWRKQDGWNLTVGTASVKKRSSRLK